MLCKSRMSSDRGHGHRSSHSQRSMHQRRPTTIHSVATSFPTISTSTAMTTAATTSRRQRGRVHAPLPSLLHQLVVALPFSLLLLPVLLSSVLHRIVVEGAESGQLLGGLYTPTTDVSHIVALSELVRAISVENDINNGTSLYQMTALGKISLESIVYPGDDAASLEFQNNDFGTGFLNPTTNVLYDLYMHALWNSDHGNNQDSSDGEPLARPYYQFLDEKVDYYGHSIINAEFSKASGYDPSLTAETIRVICLWNAAIQSLYDAVELCADASVGDVIDGSSNETTPVLVEVDINDASYISPVDKAAAFWSGDHIPRGDENGDGIPELDETDDFTLYSWAARIRTYFANPIPGEVLFDANNEILAGLQNMQTLLGSCISSPSPDMALSMRMAAEDVSRYMTVPLVQSLIHFAAGVVVNGTPTTETGSTVAAGTTTMAAPATEDPSNDKIDWAILYGLVTIPPIRVCQDYNFDTLYSELVVNAKADGNLSEQTFYDMLHTLHSRLLCLRLSCDMVGTSNILSSDNGMDADGGVWPTCTDPTADFDGYAISENVDRDTFLEYAKVDLDVRTIVALVEMDAGDAAYDVYRWGRNMRVESTRNAALMDLESEPNHSNNDVGTTYVSFFDQQSMTIGEHIRESIMGGGLLGLYVDATPGQRKIITEWTFLAISLQIHALNAMYEAIDSCNAGAQETTWDRGVAALSGWAEETADTDGLLLMEVERFFCRANDSCDTYTSDSTINGLMWDAMTTGKNGLANLSGDMSGCSIAETSVASIKKLVLTILVDAAATFADLIAQDTTNAINLAHGYGIALALAPLMQTLDTKAFGIINTNMGVFGSTAQPMVDGKNEVMDALMNFVTVAEIDCSLLTSGLCGGGGDGDVTAGLTLSPSLTPPSPSSTLQSKCAYAFDGGLPSKEGDISQPLLSNAYTPTSNVDHIVKLTELVDQISNSETNSDGLLYYTQINDGVSLQCLMMGNQLAPIINPLFVINTYGLWISSAGDGDPDGYSSKSFDDVSFDDKSFDDMNVVNYGDAVVTDSFNKETGYIPELTAETIRVLNMLMAMVTEMYRAGQSCLNGSLMDTNPVDFAAALWFGTAQDPSSSDGGTLYAWAQRAGTNFSGQTLLIPDAIATDLSELQQSYADCVALVEEEKATKGVEMRHKVDDITRKLFVPLVQNFIHHLASESGLTAVEPTEERYFVVLYSLALLPMISICDKVGFDDLFTSLIEDIGNYDARNFSIFIAQLQARYECLGISCEMIGLHSSASAEWPECKATSFAITGYLPASDSSREMWQIDLDVSTILTSIVMEANDIALDIFENGRNAMSNDGTGSYLSLNDISTPTTNNAEVNEIYQSFTSGSNGVDYTVITKNAIMGEEAFAFASVLKRSSAARLAIATIQMHIVILNNMYEAVSLCQTAMSSGTVDDGVGVYWDSAVAAAVGSTEGNEEGGSTTNGYLFYQLAQELCGYFDSCDSDGQSVLINSLMAEFAAGQSALQSSQCDVALNSRSTIERLLQSILIDNLAYHVKAASDGDEQHCLMAHVAANALVPLVRRDIEADASANTIEESVMATFSECNVNDIEAVYQALDFYVESQSINCTLLSSPVCDGTSTTDDYVGYENPDEFTSNTDGNTLFNNEYQPMMDVTNIEGLSSILSAICSSNSTDAAREAYSNDATAGITIESMSLLAKYAMADELQLNQYIYALQDGVDITDGSLLFDNKPASEYANTITSDALDISPALGCRSMKVHNIWMWIVHKLNSMIFTCKSADSTQKGLIDEAAALWDGGLLYDMAEELGPKFGHNQDGGMTYLNRKIVDRLVKARDIISNTTNTCSAADVHDLRIIVRETISYMTAVLIQSLVDSMIIEYDTVEEEQQAVELMAFATLPRIKTCGHEAAYETLQADLIINKYNTDMLANITASLQSRYNCLGLTCDDVGRHTQDNMSPECAVNLNIAGYSPVDAQKTNMLARVDLDAVAIHQMMSIEKYDIAKRIYLEGHNYYDYDSADRYNFVSLFNFTQNQTIDYSDFPMYQLYSEYYGTNDFIHEMIMQILEQTGSFADMPATQRDLALDVAISNMLSYMAALEALYDSSNMCDAVDGGAVALNAFDGAVGLLVGSVEGPEKGGSQNQEGQMFYSIAGKSCVYNDCVGNEINEQLFQALTDGQSFILERDCESATKSVENINALLKVPLVQSLIYFSDETTYEVADNVAAGYVATMAVIPIIYETDPSSATAIETAMKLDDPSWTLASKELEVRSALQVFLSSQASGINCALVTTSGKLCGTVETAYDPDEPMPISDGLYVSTNYVGDRSAIALDVKEIQSFLSQNNADEANRVYTYGLNSEIHSGNGSPTGKLRSVARFSTDSNSTMKSDPTYNIFIHGLSDENHEFMGRPATLYADSFVSNLLNANMREASIAMVAITIWMQVAHSLHASYRACQQSSLSVDRNLQNSQDPSLFIDEAAAYWIGDNQDTGSSSDGHLLYALTEFVGDKFEDIPSGSESEINMQIIDLFNKAKNHLAISRGCMAGEDSHLTLMSFIDELIPLMIIPLLRCLLYYLRENDLVLVRVYAIAALPLFSTCSPATYNELKDQLINHEAIGVNKGYIYSKIQSLYSCLGLTCDSVGFMKTDGSIGCEDDSDLKSLAGYRYEAEPEVVSESSRIDVEMKKVEIFLDNGVNHFSDSQEDVFKSAFEVYKASLRSIARDTKREVVPAFSAFRRYFAFDDYYADTMIANAFLKGGVFKGATADQRKRVIVFAMRYMVTFMAVLEKMYSALSSCRQGSGDDDGAMNLDVAVAYYVGSLEGGDGGGSYDGSLIYMLAKRMCVHFQTCTSSNDAMINERIVSLFYTGQGEAETGSCDSLERTVHEIENSLIVPLIQGTLFSARENELHFKKRAFREFYPEGYVVAQSILPILNEADTYAANEIKNVMVTKFPSQGNDDSSNDSTKVHSAMKIAVSKMEGVDCTQIGTISGAGLCPGDDGTYSALNSASVSTVSITSLTITCVILCLAFI